MTRIAGNNPGYEFRLVRVLDKDLDPNERYVEVTPYGFNFDSVTTILERRVPKPFMAGAWWGYRIAIDGLSRLPGVHDLDWSAPEEVEAALRAEKISPMDDLEGARGRGEDAHKVLEKVLSGEWELAEAMCAEETEEQGSRYGYAFLDWAKKLTDCTEVRVEQPVWSNRHEYAGTFDAALLMGANGERRGGWEIVDGKTHKPAPGFTKAPGYRTTVSGPGWAAYESDLLQVRAYRTAWEEMGNGRTVGSRVVVARADGVWLEDRREASEEAWLKELELDRFYQQGRLLSS